MCRRQKLIPSLITPLSEIGAVRSMSSRRLPWQQMDCGRHGGMGGGWSVIMWYVAFMEYSISVATYCGFIKIIFLRYLCLFLNIIKHYKTKVVLNQWNDEYYNPLVRLIKANTRHNHTELNYYRYSLRSEGKSKGIRFHLFNHSYGAE